MPPVQLLVLAPTRELAQQVEGVSNTFGRPCGIRTCCVYGGASRGPQIRELERGAKKAVALQLDTCVGHRVFIHCSMLVW